VSRPRRGARVLLYLLFVNLACSSCSHWRRQWIDPTLVVERDHPTRLRATLLDGSRVEVRNPAVPGDSLVGFPMDNREGGASVKPLAVALRDLDYVEARRSRSAPAVLFFGLVVPFALGTAIALTWR